MVITELLPCLKYRWPFWTQPMEWSCMHSCSPQTNHFLDHLWLTTIEIWNTLAQYFLTIELQQPLAVLVIVIPFHRNLHGSWIFMVVLVALNRKNSSTEKLHSWKVITLYFQYGISSRCEVLYLLSSSLFFSTAMVYWSWVFPGFETHTSVSPTAAILLQWCQNFCGQWSFMVVKILWVPRFKKSPLPQQNLTQTHKTFYSRNFLLIYGSQHREVIYM